MTGETIGIEPEASDLQKGLDHLREIFANEEADVITGTVLGMDVGDSGWAAYWAMETDTDGRRWLKPLFGLDNEPSNDACAFITRDIDGYKIDFTLFAREPREYDPLYESLYPAEQIDLTNKDSLSFIPLVEVIGEPDVGTPPPPFPGPG